MEALFKIQVFPDRKHRQLHIVKEQPWESITIGGVHQGPTVQGFTSYHPEGYIGEAWFQQEITLGSGVKYSDLIYKTQIAVKYWLTTFLSYEETDELLGAPTNQDRRLEMGPHELFALTELKRRVILGDTAETVAKKCRKLQYELGIQHSFSPLQDWMRENLADYAGVCGITKETFKSRCLEQLKRL